MNKQSAVPYHLAIIMDGNGRWAKMHGKERFEGHIQGVEAVRNAISSSVRWGVRCLTIYAFSAENWSRPQEEVSALMELFCKSVINETPQLCQQGVRVHIIGRRDRFSPKVLEYLQLIESKTADGDKLLLQIALDYSSRCELTDAVKAVAARIAAGELQASQLTEQDIEDALYTAGVPDPDLIIRTSGEQRLSNFLLWQASYAELYFPQVMWPDFNDREFDKAMEVYASRQRRYGRV